MAGLPELYKRGKEYSEVYSIMASKLGSVKAGGAKTLPRPIYVEAGYMAVSSLRGAKTLPRPIYVEAGYMAVSSLRGAKTLPRLEEGKSVAREEVERKYEIDLNRALKIARMGWEDIKRELREHLKSEWRSPEAIEAVAQALVEEARARARDIAKRHFGSEPEDLVDLIARYMLAITLAEKHIGEEVEETPTHIYFLHSE